MYLQVSRPSSTRPCRILGAHSLGTGLNLAAILSKALSFSEIAALSGGGLHLFYELQAFGKLGSSERRMGGLAEAAVVEIRHVRSDQFVFATRQGVRSTKQRLGEFAEWPRGFQPELEQTPDAGNVGSLQVDVCHSVGGMMPPLSASRSCCTDRSCAAPRAP